jgi:O-acetyl-ADP-ribose deacetylase (regulator of RNase III)
MPENENTSGEVDTRTRIKSQKQLQQQIQDLEKTVGTFSRYESSVGASENIPFSKKPAQQFLHGLGCPDETSSLSKHPSTIKAADVAVISFDDKNKTKLTITKERVVQLLASGKTYINTDIMPEGVFAETLGRHGSQEQTKEKSTEEYWQNLAVAVCHSQKIDLLATQRITDGKAITVPKSGRIDVGSPALTLLSAPALNVGYGTAREMSKDKKNTFIKAMYRNLFNAASSEGCEYIVMPAAGLGVFGGNPDDYFSALMQVATEYPDLNIVYHPAQFGSQFDKALEQYQGNNVVRATKDVVFLASELNEKGFNAALHNPSDADVVYGVNDVGEYWKHGKGAGYVGEEHIGAMSTAPLNSRGLNPNAYENIVERSLKPEHELKEEITSTPDSSISKQHKDDIEKLIDRLTKEVNSSWPYPNKDRKREKIQALDFLLKKTDKGENAAPTIEALKQKFPNALRGKISSRTSDLVQSIEQDAAPKQRLQ